MRWCEPRVSFYQAIFAEEAAGRFDKVKPTEKSVLNDE